MHVALVSIGHGPSLAIRNLGRYCQTVPGLEKVSFSFHDFDLRAFQEARNQTAQQWSWASQVDEAVVELDRLKPDIIGFSCYLWNTEHSQNLAQLLKRLSPDLLTVFGGPDAGPRAAELLKHPAIDVVIEGDGEVPLAALLGEWLDKSPEDSPLDFSRIPGLHYLDGGAQEVRSTPPTVSLDMARLAGVYDQVPQGLDAWAWPHLLYETLRGCPYRCSYCMYGKTPLNAKPVELAVEELTDLLKRGLVVEIIDPTFTTYQKRAKEILRRLGTKEYSGSLYFEAYPDSIDAEMAELMKAARVATVGIGFQTVSAAGLKAVRRPKNLERFERAVGLLRDRRISFYVDVIYGLPGTTVEDFLASIDYLNSVGEFGLVIYRLLGLPGSPMMDDAEEHGLVFNPEPPYELLRSHSFSLEDVIFCERFRHAYDSLPRVPHLEIERRGGRISPIVKTWMECDGSQEELQRRLKAEARQLDVAGAAALSS